MTLGLIKNGEERLAHKGHLILTKDLLHTALTENLFGLNSHSFHVLVEDRI